MHWEAFAMEQSHNLFWKDLKTLKKIKKKGQPRLRSIDPILEEEYIPNYSTIAIPFVGQ